MRGWCSCRRTSSTTPRLRESFCCCARASRRRGKGQILLVNASHYFVKEKPKNALTEEGIGAVAEAYRKWQTQEKLCRVITLDEAREADFNLSPSQFVEVNEREKHRPIAEILRDLEAARAERERADGELAEVLGKLELKEMIDESMTELSTWLEN